MRNNRLLNHKLNKYIIPGIMMSLALQLGNIVDTIFVSNLISVDAMSAVTMSLPVETVVQLTGYCLGIGGSIAVGNMLGRRDKESASKLFSATFLVTLVVGLIFSLCAFPTAEPIARMLVPGGSILTDYTRDYIRISMLGAPVIGIGLMMVNYLGVENHPELASTYLVLANVINLVLDYIFLRFTPLGITGASLSTVLGFLFAMFVFLFYVRIHVLCKKMLKYSYLVLAVVFIFVMTFTEQITILFGSDNGELGSQMVHALRLFIFCVVPYLWNKFIVSYYESIEETTIASFVTFLENAVALLPATFTGIYVWKKVDGIGINGIAAGFIATEIITVAATWIFRKIRHKKSTFYIVPDKNPGINLDFSIRSSMDETQNVHRKIIEFCRKTGVSANKANLAAVCAEEMTVNIIKFGGKTSNWIDINLCLEEDLCRLRIRDNGIIFNPLEYKHDSEEFDIHGIELVKKISKSMDYIRAIDMNNTIISF